MKTVNLEELNKVRNNILWFRDVYNRTNPKLVTFTYKTIHNRLVNIQNALDREYNFYYLDDEFDLLLSIYNSKMDSINKLLNNKD